MHITLEYVQLSVGSWSGWKRLNIRQFVIAKRLWNRHKQPWYVYLSVIVLIQYILYMIWKKCNNIINTYMSHIKHFIADIGRLEDIYCICNIFILYMWYIYCIFDIYIVYVIYLLYCWYIYCICDIPNAYVIYLLYM